MDTIVTTYEPVDYGAGLTRRCAIANTKGYHVSDRGELHVTAEGAGNVGVWNTGTWHNAVRGTVVTLAEVDGEPTTRVSRR